MKKGQKDQDKDQSRKDVKSLKLHKETLSRLESTELRQVAGAAETGRTGTFACCQWH